jgi:hypothetical protein
MFEARLRGLRFPSEEEIEQGNRFRTYLNYICSISAHLKHLTPKSFLKTITSSDEFGRIKRHNSDILEIEKLLRNAWLTEVKLHIDGEDNEFTTYSNHWAPVQLYYSAYLSLRAYFTANASQVPNEHTKNLKAINNDILNKSSLFPFPFHTMCLCGGARADDSKFINMPQGVCINKISGLTKFDNVEFYDSFALCLKTTRDKQIEKLCEDWRHRNKKKRVPALEKEKMVKNMGPTSLFNFLYRLRLRSNYEDADSFLFSQPTILESQDFNKSLRVICWYTQFMLETLIARYIGEKTFVGIVQKFEKFEKYGFSKKTVGNRSKLIYESVS